MSEKEIGRIGWVDLTVPNADEIRDFYEEVVGWKHSEVPMGEYSDFNMSSPDTNEPKAGVCHARGMNAGLPAQWMIYITVANLDRSMENCRSRGGKVILGPREMPGYGRYCMIQDPAGAVAALFEHQ